jgi:hypothetical protein
MMIGMIMMMMIFMLMMVSTTSGSSICGKEFQPCRTDRDPNDTTISLEDCCEGYTCLSTNDYVPPFHDPESAWGGLCLTDRSRKIALLSTDLKKYMIRKAYEKKETMTKDHKQAEESDYLSQLHMEGGDFPQLIIRMERKFNIQIEIPDEIPDDYEL